MTSPERGGPHLTVLELHDVIDLCNESAVEHDLRLLMPGGGMSVVIDIRTPLVTVSAVNLLLRLGRTAQARGTTLAVSAHHPSARRVFRITGLSRALRVAATPSGAAALTRGCAIPVPDADPARRPDRNEGAPSC
ncbi:STAS domain-containing protein [Streptomyces sp. NPDC049040]|uniref:STAS domain-containing protein n=1 Tax=Streptomyces sp. NPDC049040 TaxID=3365593 RepID=UPI003718FA83